MIRPLIRKILFSYRLAAFKLKWKLKNKHNQTFPVNNFESADVSVGKHSYGPLEVYSWGSSNESLKIGSFCSIASGVKFILGGVHVTNYFSTYPMNAFFKLNSSLDFYSKGSIELGDDVWLGMDAMILSGVKIGRGAIIGAGAVIVKDVAPYSIMGGNPAKIIGDRFTEDIKNKMMSIDFGNMTKDNILLLKDLWGKEITSSNIDELLTIAGK